MKNLYLAGAGGLGREVLNIVQDIHLVQGQQWNIKGFLDDTQAPLLNKACDFAVVGTIKDYIPKANDVVVVCIGDPTTRRRLVEMLKALGAIDKSLIVLPSMEEKIIKSARNISGVKTAQVNTMNVYDIVNARKLIILKDAVSKIEEVYA